MVFEIDLEIVREYVCCVVLIYMLFENYYRVWCEGGFVDEDFVGGGSDYFIDIFIVWGD